MRKKVISWIVLICFITASNYGWAQSSTISTLNSTIDAIISSNDASIHVNSLKIVHNVASDKGASSTARVTAIYMLGQLCVEGVASEEDKQTIYKVALDEYLSAVNKKYGDPLFTALTYLNVCMNTKDIDEKTYSLIMTAIQSALNSSLKKEELTATIALIKGLGLSKTQYSLSYLQILSNYCINKKGLLQRASYTAGADTESNIGKIQTALIEQIAYKRYDWEMFKGQFSEKDTYGFLSDYVNLKYDHVNESKIKDDNATIYSAMVLAEIPRMGNEQVSKCFYKKQGNSISPRRYLLRITINGNVEPEVRVTARGLLLDRNKCGCNSYTEIGGANGTRKIITCEGDTLKAPDTIDYALYEKKIQGMVGQAYIFIAEWYLMAGVFSIAGKVLFRVLKVLGKIAAKAAPNVEKAIIKLVEARKAKLAAKYEKYEQQLATEVKQNEAFVAKANAGDQSVVSQRYLQQEIKNEANNSVNLAGANEPVTKGVVSTTKQVAVDASGNPVTQTPLMGETTNINVVERIKTPKDITISDVNTGTGNLQRNVNIPETYYSNSFVSDAAGDPKKMQTINEFCSKLRYEYKLSSEELSSQEFKNKVLTKFNETHECPLNARTPDGLHSLKAQKLKEARKALQDYLEQGGPGRPARKMLQSEIDELYKPLMDEGVLGKSSGPSLDEIADKAKDFKNAAKTNNPGDLDGQIKELTRYTMQSTGDPNKDLLIKKAVESAINDVEKSKTLYANNPTRIVDEANDVIKKQASSSEFRELISVNKEYASNPETYANSLSKMMEMDQKVLPNTYKDVKMYVNDAITSSDDIELQITNLNKHKQMIIDASNQKRSLLNKISNESDHKVFNGVDDYVTKLKGQIDTNETNAVKTLTDKIAELETKVPPDKVANKIISNIESEHKYDPTTQINKLKEAKTGKPKEVQDLIDKQITKLETSIQNKTLFETNQNEARKIATDIQKNITKNTDSFFQRIKVKTSQITKDAPETFANMENQNQIYVKYTSTDYTNQIKNSVREISNSSINNADKIKSLEKILLESDQNYDAAREAVKQVEKISKTEPAFSGYSPSDAVEEVYTKNALRKIQFQQDNMTKSIKDLIQKLS